MRSMEWIEQMDGREVRELVIVAVCSLLLVVLVVWLIRFADLM